MITYSEENAVKLSATKKDFYQIWNELLETARKISERWDPTSTNESDPGIVLLKVLTAVADKLNYNIDINALESFMPSAAQEESMRKLTEMLGYTMKYYQSATTNVQIAYNKAESAAIKNQIYIDRFTNIKDIDDTINYVTLKTVYLNKDMTSVEVPCIEGELVECETDDDNIISLMQLDDNNRYYLPETQIAENGIFVTNIDNELLTQESEDWEKVDNLNAQPVNKKCFKFGYDSRYNLPYIQFPDDISALIEDGLKIKYIRTNGANGNISPKTLYKMEKPASWQLLEENADETANLNDAAYLSVDNYTVYNAAAATNGANIESLTDAYNNYKKTIGTFNTLVTCRDYMNKIYQMTVAENNATPLVSNIIVSDIRDDINKANIFCTFGAYGIEYNNVSQDISNAAVTYEFSSRADWLEHRPTADESTLNNLYKVHDTVDGKEVIYYYKVISDGNSYDFAELSSKKLDHFDLVFYPFRNTYGLNTKTEYTRSFKYDDSNILEILQGIEQNKTLSHNIIKPDKSDIACIKNYFNLNAKITTTRKVNVIEQKSILNNIYTKLYANFNMRKIDFGEELPYDSILKVMENADPRIKNVSLEDPTLSTKFCTVAGGEYEFSTAEDVGSANKNRVGNSYYNKLVLNNVLAGRIPLFNYDDTFKTSYNERDYPAWGSTDSTKYNLLYPNEINKDKTNGIEKITTEFKIDLSSGKASNIKLKANEIVQFRFPNLKTVITYPAYVNYYLRLNNNDNSKKGIPATMQTLTNFLNSTTGNSRNWEALANGVRDLVSAISVTSSTFDKKKADNGALFKIDGDNYVEVATFEDLPAGEDETRTAYYVAYNDYSTEHFMKLEHWITNLKIDESNAIIDSQSASNLTGIYYFKNRDENYSYGELVDNTKKKYLKASDKRNYGIKPFDNYYIQAVHAELSTTGDPETWHTKDGLGQNAVPITLTKDGEYQLKPGEYLLINYTSSTSTEGSAKTVINKCYKGDDGIIIRPNFDLADSASYRTLHKYNKTDNFYFSGYQGIKQPEGMFTLGTDQQIEIREFVEVQLDKASTNIYWHLQDETPDTNGNANERRIYFPWNEEPIDKETGEPLPNVSEGTFDKNTMIYSAYVLKDGEYFYYTDSKKSDIAIYGAGTKISRTIHTPAIYKSTLDSAVATEDIASFGIDAPIPWRPYMLSDLSEGQSRALTITEYQYITLAEGSVLESIECNGVDKLNNEPHACSKATYKFSSDAGSEQLPTVNFANRQWEVRTKLLLNVGPNTIQQLYATDNTVDRFIVKEKANPDTITFEPHNGVALALKANKLIQSTLDTTMVGYINVDDTGSQATYYDCQLKVFKLDELRDADGTTLNTNNFNDNFTRIVFKSKTVDRTAPFLSLNAIIPENRIGLLMIYYNRVGTAERAFIKTNNNVNAPEIYNNNDSWWTDLIVENADLYAIEGLSFNSNAEGAQGMFDSLKSANNLYKKETCTEQEAIGNKYLHSKAEVGNSTAYYKYTKLAADYTMNAGENYCSLIDVGASASNKATVYELRDGINIIKLEQSCVLQIFADGDNKDNIIFGDLKLINASNPLNPKLCYKKIDDTVNDAYEQALKDISSIDPENKFYYNVPMNNEIALDLNEKSDSDTLENPLNWYNYNNVNNKFVVSEINADYLTSGITIARNSKL